MNLDSYLKCHCGKRSDAFSFLVSKGFARSELIANFQSFETDIEEMLPRLRCSKCLGRGLVRLYTKPEVSNPPPKKRVPFSQRLVGTDRGINRVFHKQTCGYAKMIRREDEVFFDTREEAVARKFDPCRSCKP